ncbi:BLUF domain-containing protein [Methylobacterium radiodurans]|uniref:Blue light sensor protein n=1 Tax=Methylobacterium radiodurans TaxID=2202828 RepID=A0A2U8VRU8_9HYPH|nr:BLUF domain-containing protein [Methylobacterium radiodurans]AWN36002.1 blue light sensor protein [Methylobacterium radiodurans]
MSELYRLVYASKNLLQGSEAEIAEAVSQILAASQRNNAAVAVTGALMFNAGAFAQVLEGPREGVETTFERIQCDPRHGDVTVLQCGSVEERTFVNWSMAFVGQSEQGRASWEGLAAQSGFDLTRLDGDAVFAMLHGLVLEEEGLPAAPISAPATAAVPVRQAAKPSSGMDVERVRAELPQLGREPHAAPDADLVSTAEPAVMRRAAKDEPPQAAKTDVTLAVLRASLAQERQLTTDLRNDLDEVRVVLALQQEQLEKLRGERDLWANRAQLLANAMSQEARTVKDASPRDAAETPGTDRYDRSVALRAIA